VLLGLLESLKLMFRGSVCLAFLVEHISKLAGFEAIRFEKAISKFDEAFFLGENCFGSVEVADRIL
jgi:hypothetical protein